MTPGNMRTGDFDYHLPVHLIAQTPAEPRDSSRLLVLHRDTGRREHRRFHELPRCLREGDVLVFNDSRVIPARLYGMREDTGGSVEVLLLSRIQSGVWRAIGKPARSLVPGRRFVLDGQAGVGAWMEVLEVSEDDTLTLRLSSEEAVERVGHVPLPPYIHSTLEDPERYQTVYARIPGSVAAPTAGLHFTPELMRELETAGIRSVYVTLHVSLDTFRPIHVEDPTEHAIHGEYFHLDQEAATTLNRARWEERRVIAVGTTSVRLLEQAALLSEAAGSSELVACSGRADLYILPGHRFRVVDAMITNFHLPRTTLLMMVSAFAGRELVLEAYGEAIARDYRFYSFGDGMLIL